MGRASVVCGRRGRVSLPGGPAAQVLEGRRSGPGTPGSDAGPFAFRALRLYLCCCVPSGTLRGLSAHLHGVRLRGLACASALRFQRHLRAAWPVPPTPDCAWLRPTLSSQPVPAGSCLSVLLHTLTVGWRRLLLFYILKT